MIASGTMEVRIEDALTDYVRSQATAAGPVSADTDLLESNVLDSLLLMDLVLHVEATYDIQFENSEIAPRYFRTIRCLARLIENKVRFREQHT